MIKDKDDDVEGIRGTCVSHEALFGRSNSTEEDLFRIRCRWKVEIMNLKEI